MMSSPTLPKTPETPPLPLGPNAPAPAPIPAPKPRFPPHLILHTSGLQPTLALQCLHAPFPRLMYMSGLCSSHALSLSIVTSGSRLCPSPSPSLDNKRNCEGERRSRMIQPVNVSIKCCSIPSLPSHPPACSGSHLNCCSKL